MAKGEDDFRVRMGRARGGGSASRAGRLGARPKSFVGEVHQAIRRAGGDPNRLPSQGKASGRFNARGRGGAAAVGLKSRSVWSRDASGARSRSRRVAVKARVVKLNPQRGAVRGRQVVSAKAVGAHLRYLERDGVTRDGEKGQAYSAEQDVADGQAFLDRGQDDRHQFRFIVSAEDGVELSDLRQTTRDLMRQMEADLETRLDWIAVDHHNTGHPHTHILLRGVTEDGKTLNIAGDYIAHGIRERASEIVTLELGRQSEQEVSRSLEREVDADRFTRLDRMLIAEQDSHNEFIDLRPDKDLLETLRQNRALLIQRATKLERMGLAVQVDTGRWVVLPKAEPVLRELGEQGDIIKTMHRALDREGLAEDRHPSRYVLHREPTTERLVGRVLDKGLSGDEMGDRVRLVIDGVDGRVHHIELDAARAEEVRPGMIVAAGSGPPGPRASDLNIVEVAGPQGVYRPSEHLARSREAIERVGGDPEAFVKSHVRRLEALRRGGHVERLDADQWRVPADLAERGQAYDRSRDGANIRVSVLSPMTLDRQVAHEGATWLDKELVSPQRTPLGAEGFGRDVAQALERRKRSLIDAGHLTDLGAGRVRGPRDLLQRLDAAEVERVGKALAIEHGRSWKPAVAGEFVSGQLLGSTQLASGRFAMIDDGLGFQLVPWRPVLEQHIGRHITGVAMPGGGIDWTMGRQVQGAWALSHSPREGPDAAQPVKGGHAVASGDERHRRAAPVAPTLDRLSPAWRWLGKRSGRALRAGWRASLQPQQDQGTQRMMKTSLDHLPETKRRELARIVEILFSEFQDAIVLGTQTHKRMGCILKVVLYGSYARGDWVDDPIGGYTSDYDLLVVVNHDKLTDMVEYWSKAEDHLLTELTLAKRLSAPVSLIVHSLADVNAQLQRGRPFFVDIVRDGIALYEAPGHEFAQPKTLEPAEALREAQGYFDEWFESAADFRGAATEQVAKGKSKLAAFLLHQATERLYHCLLLVLSLYSPKSHKLNFLRSQAEQLDQRLVEAWPRATKFEQRCFEQLRRAYVDARYSPQYQITVEELAWLGERIVVLQDLVRAACQARLDLLAA